MGTPRARSTGISLILPLALLVCFGCGGDDNGPDDQQTGTTLQGTVTAFQAQMVNGGFGLAWTEGVTSRDRFEVHADGRERRLHPARLRYRHAERDVLARRRKWHLRPDRRRARRRVLIDLIQISGGQVSTQHTGTWVGTGGSTDPSSQGQVALTMIIAQNGNSVTGTASIGPPDNTSWNITGTETGHTLNNTHLTVTSTNSPCAAGAELLDATFVGDTLSGTFIEEDVPQDCGLPESGFFRVVKQ